MIEFGIELTTESDGLRNTRSQNYPLKNVNKEGHCEESKKFHKFDKYISIVACQIEGK